MYIISHIQFFSIKEVQIHLSWAIINLFPYLIYYSQLLFMNRGGELIYVGPLRRKSCKLVEFFEVGLCSISICGHK